MNSKKREAKGGEGLEICMRVKISPLCSIHSSNVCIYCAASAMREREREYRKHKHHKKSIKLSRQNHSSTCSMEKVRQKAINWNVESINNEIKDFFKWKPSLFRCCCEGEVGKWKVGKERNYHLWNCMKLTCSRIAFHPDF